MRVEFCNCEKCRSMFKHSIVRRSLENEFPVLLADDYYSNESKHFICAKWDDFIIRLAIKTEYNNIGCWSDN